MIQSMNESCNQPADGAAKLAVDSDKKVSFSTLPTQPQPTESDHELIVMNMMEMTGQEKDVCYFYLESVNWNLSEAIELMKSMDAPKG
jgi:hypothetical protein